MTDLQSTVEYLLRLLDEPDLIGEKNRIKYWHRRSGAFLALAEALST